jgi:hypothetical protein
MKLRRTTVGILAVAAAALAQDRRASIDVEKYRIAVQIDPAAQQMRARAEVTFTPLDDNPMSAVFELNNALAVDSVTGAAGERLASSRNVQDYTVRVDFQSPLPKGKPQTIVFQYGGRLTGTEESPIYGIKFAAIQADYAYLLYPSRWFPVNGYTADRYGAEISVTAPDTFRAVGSGMEKSERVGGNATYTFTSLKPGFPGSVALVRGAARRVSSQGFNSDIWFRGGREAHAPAFGDEIGKVMTYLGSVFGLPPSRTLMVVETDDGAPNGYSAPGLLFLSPGAISAQPGQRLLANQLTRQWFGNLFSAVNRNHIWIVNGMARYAEILYQESLNGAGAVEADVNDLYVDALTVTDIPVRQAVRIEDYSPEFFALTGSKGAVVYHMLRWILGDAEFGKALKALAENFADRSIATDDLRKVAEQSGAGPLQGFFIQWLESTGAPEFTLEYTIYRTQKGFRVMGKITQDLDTFRMPVELKIETEGNPETKRVDVGGPATEFAVDTFGKPKRVVIDPNGRVLRLSPDMRMRVAIRRGEQFAEIGEYNEALKEYQKALDVNRISSLAHYRVAEVFFLQGNYQSAANEFRESLNGDLEPKWTDVWAHIQLGKIFDITQQRERAVNEYTLAVRTKDNTQGAQEEAARYLKTPYQRQEKN